MERDSNHHAAPGAPIRSEVGAVFTGALVLLARLGGDDSRRARRRRRRARARGLAHGAARLLLAGLMLLTMLLLWSLRWAGARIASGIAHGARLLAGSAARPTAAVAASSAAVAPADASSPADGGLLAQARALEREGHTLPSSVRPLVAAIGQRLQRIAEQLPAVAPEASERSELRRLTLEELPELLRTYRRLPADLPPTPTDAQSPEQQLLVGLTIIDGELANLQRRLASNDLRALSTQLRYLTLKYGAEGHHLQ